MFVSALQQLATHVDVVPQLTPALVQGLYLLGSGALLVFVGYAPAQGRACAAELAGFFAVALYFYAPRVVLHTVTVKQTISGSFGMDEVELGHLSVASQDFLEHGFHAALWIHRITYTLRRYAMMPSIVAMIPMPQLMI